VNSRLARLFKLMATEASSASASETELREALRQAQTQPRPEPSGRASRAVHASLRVLNAAARGEPVAEDDR
jgi:hypothetical protein